MNIPTTAFSSNLIPGKKVLVATPAYNTSVSHQYAVSLAETCSLLRARNVFINSSIIVAGSLLCKTRNLILKGFMNSDATHLLCVDSDLGWPADAVAAMLAEDRDFVCGVYPARDMNDPTNTQYMFVPETYEDGCFVRDQRLIKAKYVPAGFMLIKRVVIERMIAKFPERYTEPAKNTKNSEPMHVFFNTEIHDGEYWGEDYTFCRLVRESGTDIWVDPTIPFDHAGKQGALIDSLIVGKSREEVLKKSEQFKSEPIKFNLVRGAA